MPKVGRAMRAPRVWPGTKLEVCPWCHRRGGTETDELKRKWHADCMRECSR